MRFTLIVQAFAGCSAGAPCPYRTLLSVTTVKDSHWATSVGLWRAGRTVVWRPHSWTLCWRSWDPSCGRVLNFPWLCPLRVRRWHPQHLISPRVRKVSAEVTLLLWIIRQAVQSLLFSWICQKWRCVGRWPRLPYSFQNRPGIWVASATWSRPWKCWLFPWS